MKKIVLTSLLVACLPLAAAAQNADDDLYFVPKKKTEKKEVKVVVPQKEVTTTVYAPSGSTVVVKENKGYSRDVDEYNRRYTSRDNTFTMENDTLYIEEKPLSERGEWVNGFEGSQADYEYAMRIIRFRNPRYAIPVSSPLYWDVVYTLPSWEWNVFDDGLYAYAFPTYSNRLWWDWRFSYPYRAGWSFSWGWTSPWYAGWGYPGYWGGYWGWHHHHHYHPHYPHYSAHGWGGGYWGGGHGWYGSSRRSPSIHSRRYTNTYANGRGNRDSYLNTNNGRSSRNTYIDRQSRTTQASGRRASGRVVTGNNGAASVRPNRTAVRTRTGEAVSTGRAAGVRSGGNSYTRPTTENRVGSSYNRPSSTRSSVSRTSERTGAASRGAYRNSGSTSRNGSYSRSSSRSRNTSSYRSGGSTSRSSGSFSSGGGSSSRSSGAGGGSRRR